MSSLVVALDAVRWNGRLQCCEFGLGMAAAFGSSPNWLHLAEKQGHHGKERVLYLWVDHLTPQLMNRTEVVTNASEAASNSGNSSCLAARQLTPPSSPVHLPLACNHQQLCYLRC